MKMRAVLAAQPGRRGASFQLRLAVGLAVVAVVLPGVAFGISRLQIKRALADRVQEGELATARSIASELHLGLNFAVTYTQAAAHRPGVVSYVQRRDVESLSSATDNIVGSTKLFHRLAVFDATGSPLAQRGESIDPVTPQMTEPSAAVMAPRQQGADAVLPVREPITAPGGETLGVLYAEISFTTAAPASSELRFGKTGRASVVDAGGMVLLSGEPQRVGRRLGAPELLSLVGTGRADTLTYYSPVLRRQEVGAFVPVPGYGWGVLVAQAESEAYADLDRVTRSLFLAFAAFLPIGLAIVWLVSRAVRGYHRRLAHQLHEQERLNHALEAFSSRVAHDLKDPIATARLAAEVGLSQSQHGRSPQLVSDVLGTVDGQLTRALYLIDDLLLLARATGTARRQRVDLAALVTDVASGMPSLQMDLSLDAQELWADPVALRQALVNLLGNAVRYAQVDGVAQVTVRCHEEAEGWVISVADRGPGVPAEEVGRIFEPLYRGSTTGAPTGTGLGLSIVEAVAETHSGWAWYEPRTGGGSVFSLLLGHPPDDPDAQAEEVGAGATTTGDTGRSSFPSPALVPVAASKPASPAESSPVARPARRFSVVLVDDLADLRRLLRAVLEESSRFEVVGEAEDGVEAVEVVGATSPDIVLLDLSMPRAGGLEALPQIRERSPGSKVIVLSSLERDRMAPSVLSDGAVGYLEKGLRASTLIDEVLALAGLLEIAQAILEEARTTLVPQPQSAGAARRFAAEMLQRWDCEELLDVMNLLISEVVTNAVLHAGTDVQVTVQLTATGIRVDVLDEDPAMPALREAAPGDTSGRGLALVEAMAEDWGVEPAGAGKRVWFQLSRTTLVAAG